MSSPLYRHETSEQLACYEDALSIEALNHFGWQGTRDLCQDTRILVISEQDSAECKWLKQQVGQGSTCLEQCGLGELSSHPTSAYDVIVALSAVQSSPEPVEVLRQLQTHLNPDGLIVLSVPATYAHMGLHLVQALMQHLVEDYMPAELKIQIAREFLKAVPQGHWLEYNNTALLAALDAPDGSGIQALLLDSPAPSFTLVELYGTLDQAGLAMVQLLNRDAGYTYYQPESYTQSAVLTSLVSEKPFYEREIVAELMHGSMPQHVCYVGAVEKTPAPFADTMIPCWAPSWKRELPRAASELPSTPHRALLVAHIDGTRDITSILTEVGKQTGVSVEILRHEMETLYNTLSLQQRVFLKTTSNLNA